jgi:hypothetical protein
MPKYYVQCGPIQCILTADSAQQAALSALGRTLQSHLWVYDDPDLSEQDCRDHFMLEALLHLEPTVSLSERGFDRSDAQHVGTPEPIDRGNRLMLGMKRLFITAGMAPKSMAQVATRAPQFPAARMRRPR